MPPPAAAQVYELTPYGEELREPLYALARWGARSLGPPTDDDALAPGWLVNAVRATLGRWDGDPDAAFELRGGSEEVVTVRFENGEPVVEAGSSGADIVIHTDPATLFCMASREQTIKEAIGAGAVRITGKRSEAERFLSLFSFAERGSYELEHV